MLTKKKYTTQSRKAIYKKNRADLNKQYDRSSAVSKMATEPLSHLTEQSAGVGAWMLKVTADPKDSEYSWSSRGKSGKGRKLEFCFVSEDSTVYCPFCLIYR